MSIKCPLKTKDGNCNGYLFDYSLSLQYISPTCNICKRSFILQERERCIQCGGKVYRPSEISCGIGARLNCAYCYSCNTFYSHHRMYNYMINTNVISMITDEHNRRCQNIREPDYSDLPFMQND